MKDSAYPQNAALESGTARELSRQIDRTRLGILLRRIEAGRMRILDIRTVSRSYGLKSLREDAPGAA